MFLPFFIPAYFSNRKKKRMNDKKKDGSSIGGIMFVGCMFVGAGIGMLFGNVPAGGAIGMGVGFLAMGGIWAYFRDK